MSTPLNAELTGPSHLGEVFSGRHALERAPLALATQRTLEQLRNPVRSPTTPYAPLSEALQRHQPKLAFELDKDLFVKNKKCARSGAAAGPSDIMTKHLRPILENFSDVGLLFQVAQFFATASIPQEILEAFRVGRFTALQKPNGGVRGIVAGDVFRRLVARTMAQQLGPEIVRATSPFQYALSTRASTECIAHAIQALTDLNPKATVLSIDGIGAQVFGRDAALPFVKQFYGFSVDLFVGGPRRHCSHHHASRSSDDSRFAVCLDVVAVLFRRSGQPHYPHGAQT